MADSVYRVTEVIGVSSESWEAAARSAVETAAKSVRDLRDRRGRPPGRHGGRWRRRELPRPSRDLVQVRVGRLGRAGSFGRPAGRAERGRQPARWIGAAASGPRVRAHRPRVAPDRACGEPFATLQRRLGASRRTAPISPRCMTEWATSARHCGWRWGSSSSRPVSYAQWCSQHSGRRSRCDRSRRVSVARRTRAC